MLSQPTTDKILLAIADDLNAVIAPAIADEQAKVLLGQAEQLLRRLSRRSASEIAWMVEEITEIEDVLGGGKDQIQRGEPASRGCGETLLGSFSGVRKCY